MNRNESRPTVSIRGLELSFGNRRVLAFDALDLDAGTIVLLSGPNGSGKTSLLKILAGLVKPQHATIACDGSAMSIRAAMAFWRGRHIYLHQQPYLFDTTVAANIGYGLKLRGQSRVQRELQIQAALEWAELDHLADRPTHMLSTGERQRIALTRAKLLNPNALLVDEIIANMDAASRARSRELLLELSRAGVTIVIASHETGQFDDIADAHLVLEDGRLVSGHAGAEIIPIGRRQQS